MSFRRFRSRLGMGVALLQLVVSLPAYAFSNQEERELGKRFDLAARQQLPLFDDPEIVGYVDTIGQRIVSGLKDRTFTYQFSVVQEGSVNAFAVPGGYIYVHSGLLTRANNDDEVAAVLAHEVAHVHAHHLARQQEATKLLNYASLLGVLLSVVNPAIGGLPRRPLPGRYGVRPARHARLLQEAERRLARPSQNASISSVASADR
jgi:predicted Zn-dependent protease